MKLHRIQATNLNSLYGEQAVDLDVELGGASLFLVLGPTGSGKSTLMDAVSLALFGTTPRLEKLRSEIAVAEQVMSRGTGTAQAVAVFSKVEQGVRMRYRATWAARRARGRADGTMQPTQRSLERLSPDGGVEILVDDARDKVVRPVFDEVLEHFTAQDFQRSMLLAQGRFDAMLHAEPEERASILERLTATVVYKELGTLAAGVRALWAERLRELGAAVAAVAPPSIEALAALQLRVTEGTERAKALDARVVRLVGWRGWVLRASELETQAVEARAEEAQVQRAEAEAAEEIAALGEHERCAEAFTLRDQAQRAAGQVARLKAQHARLEASLPGLGQACTLAREVTSRAEAALTAAEGALTALRGPVQEAQEAQQGVARAQEGVEEARMGRKRRAQAVKREERRQLDRTAARRTAEEVLAADEEALARLAGDEPLAQALPELEQRGVRLAVASSHAGERREALESQAKALAEREATLVAEWAVLAEDRSAKLTPREAERARRDAELAALVGETGPAEALRALCTSKESTARRVQRIEVAGQALEARVCARQRREERGAVLAVARAAQVSADAEVAAAERGLTVAEASLAGAAAAVAEWACIAAHGEQRPTLVEGEPCPLCGSRTHPYVSDAEQRARAEAVASELVRAQETEGEARAALEQARRRRGTAGETAAGARVALQGAERELASAEEQLRQAETSLGRALEEAGLASDTAAVAAPLTEAAAEAERLAARVGAVEQAEASARAAREALAQEERALQVRAAELERRDSALEEARAAHSEAAEGLRKAEAACDAQRQVLAAALGVFGIQAEPAEVGLRAAGERAQAWTRAKAKREDAARRLDGAARDLLHGADTLDKARVEAAVAEGTLQAREKVLAVAQAAAGAAEISLVAAWAAAIALDGSEAVERPAADAGPVALLASQEARVAALRRATLEARRGLSQASTEQRAAEARAEELGGQLAAQRAEHAEIEAQVGAALAGLGLPGLEQLDALRLGQERLRDLRAQREALRAARARVGAAIEAAQGQLTRHAEVRPEDFPEGASAEGLAEDLAGAREEREAQGQVLDQARADLRVAERDQAAHAEAQGKYDRALERARVWLDLHELIGKAEGKHFQMFAQAMNLHRLLARANQHLGRLSERYRLCPLRDPATGLPSLDFVVEDAWQVGSTRSLRTLSGGESFLVSLALALALSDLRTSSMPVETLMLDEGFGTLDPHTLEIALSALEQLQAAGRQVGIISHVASLRERIQARIVVEPVGEGRSRVRAELR